MQIRRREWHTSTQSFYKALSSATSPASNPDVLSDALRSVVTGVSSFQFLTPHSLPPLESENQISKPNVLPEALRGAVAGAVLFSNPIPPLGTQLPLTLKNRFSNRNSLLDTLCGVVIWAVVLDHREEVPRRLGREARRGRKGFGQGVRRNLRELAQNGGRPGKARLQRKAVNLLYILSQVSSMRALMGKIFRGPCA